MTVEKWLRGKLQGIGNQLTLNELQVAVDATGDIDDERFMAISLTDEKDDYRGNKIFLDSLWYALSELLSAMSTATNTGQKSEKRGNRQITTGGISYTKSDRDRYLNRANEIRKNLGLAPKDMETDREGMSDYTYMRNRPNTCTKGGWR